MRDQSGQHQLRLSRAVRSLDGLMTGDGFGGCFFGETAQVNQRLTRRDFPQPIWHLTDDSVMACGLVEILARKGRVDQDALARSFANNYIRDPMRGYGPYAQNLLKMLASGGDWRALTNSLGSDSSFMGIGAAMRVAPLGAYFADDLAEVITQARLQSSVTHHHPESVSGAIAVAVAAATAWNLRPHANKLECGRQLLETTLANTPAGLVHARLETASTIAFDCELDEAIAALGHGEDMSVQATIPYAIWCAARCMGDYQETLWCAVSGLGKRDSACAIAGGIAALAQPVPKPWWACVEESGFVAYLRDGFAGD